MADREAKLRLIFELVKAGRTQEALAAINAEMTAGAAAAEKTAGALVSTAAAADDVAESEAKAAGETGKLAGALSTVGDTATDAGQKTASASAQGAQAVQGVTASTEELASSTREAGRAAVESGEDVESAAREAGTAVDRLTQDWKETIEAARSAGLAFDADSAKGSIEELAASIRSSGDSLEKQKAALEGLAAGIVDEFKRVETSSESAGTETTDQGKLIEAALANVRGKIAEVDAGLRKIGDAGAEGAGEVAAGFLSVDQALQLANKSADDAVKRLTDTGRLPKTEIRELAEVIETVNIAMERSAAVGKGATESQIANASALRGKLEELNLITNRQTDASQDNAVALKDQAGQVQALAQAVGGMIGLTGNAGTALSSFAAKGTGAFVAFDNAKNAIKAMNLNTLQLGVSSAAGKTQIGLMVAALLASAAVGFKAASANGENANEISRLSSAVKALKDSALSGLSDRWDGAQFAAQKFVETLLSVDESVGSIVSSVGRDSEQITSNLDDLAHTLNEVALASGRGRDAVDVYNAALREGIPDQQAFTIAVADSERVQKFMRDAHVSGAEGLRLWREGLQQAQGDAQKLSEYVEQNSAAMIRAVAANKAVIAAQKEQREAAEALRGTLDALDLVLGSDRTDEFGLKVTALGASLLKAAEKSKALSNAERDRLRLIGELLARGADMTVQQQVFAGLLVNQARAGKEASEVLNRLTQLILDFNTATGGSTKEIDTLRTVLGELNANYEANSQKIRAVVDDMQAQLDATDNLTAAQRASAQEQIDWFRAVEEERARIAGLAAERTARYARDTVEQEQRVRTAIRDHIEELRQLIPLSGSYGADIAEIGSAITALANSTSALTRAERERLEIIAELAAKGEDLNAVEREWATQLLAAAAAGQAASKATNDLAEAQIRLAGVTEGITLAFDGTTSAINLHLDAIAKAIGAGEQHSVVLERLAAALLAETSNTDGLTNAQRAQIEAVAELATKSEDLTTAQKAHVLALIEEIKAGNERIVVSRDLAAADDARTTAIRTEIEAIREAIAAEEQRLGVRKEETKANNYAGASLEFLRQRERALQEETEQGIYIVRASTEAKQGEADISLERIKHLNDEAQANEKLRTSHETIFSVVKDGRVEITNLAAAESALSAQGVEVVKTNEQLKKSADDAADTMRHLGTAFDGTTITLDTFMQRAKQLLSVVDDVNEKLRELDKTAQTVAGQ